MEIKPEPIELNESAKFHTGLSKLFNQLEVRYDSLSTDRKCLCKACEGCGLCMSPDHDAYYYVEKMLEQHGKWSTIMEKGSPNLLSVIPSIDIVLRYNDWLLKEVKSDDKYKVGRECILAYQEVLQTFLGNLFKKYNSGPKTSVTRKILKEYIAADLPIVIPFIAEMLQNLQEVVPKTTIAETSSTVKPRMISLNQMADGTINFDSDTS